MRRASALALLTTMMIALKSGGVVPFCGCRVPPTVSFCQLNEPNNPNAIVELQMAPIDVC
jgi:hypothetical protein